MQCNKATKQELWDLILSQTNALGPANGKEGLLENKSVSNLSYPCHSSFCNMETDKILESCISNSCGDYANS